MRRGVGGKMRTHRGGGGGTIASVNVKCNGADADSTAAGRANIRLRLCYDLAIHVACTSASRQTGRCHLLCTVCVNWIDGQTRRVELRSLAVAAAIFGPLSLSQLLRARGGSRRCG